MAQVEVRDNSLWIKHVSDRALRDKLRSFAQGEEVTLLVDGQREKFKKMKDGPQGPTPGWVPVVGSRGVWGKRYRERPGELVEVKLEDDEEPPPSGAPAPVAPIIQGPDWSAATPAERDAAWQAFKALTRAGWRSDPASSGDDDRDDLHQR